MLASSFLILDTLSCWKPSRYICPENYVVDNDAVDDVLSSHCIHVDCTFERNGRIISLFDGPAPNGIVRFEQLRDIEEAIQAVICPDGLEECTAFPVSNTGECVERMITSTDCALKATAAVWTESLPHNKGYGSFVVEPECQQATWSRHVTIFIRSPRKRGGGGSPPGTLLACRPWTPFE
jgi:hypothetical protein